MSLILIELLQICFNANLTFGHAAVKSNLVEHWQSIHTYKFHLCKKTQSFIFIRGFFFERLWSRRIEWHLVNSSAQTMIQINRLARLMSGDRLLLDLTCVHV